ncbi:protein of unknown function [Streptomyces murinus]
MGTEFGVRRSASKVHRSTSRPQAATDPQNSAQHMGKLGRQGFGHECTVPDLDNCQIRTFCRGCLSQRYLRGSP